MHGQLGGLHCQSASVVGGGGDALAQPFHTCPGSAFLHGSALLRHVLLIPLLLLLPLLLLSLLLLLLALVVLLALSPLLLLLPAASRSLLRAFD